MRFCAVSTTTGKCAEVDLLRRGKNLGWHSCQMMNSRFGYDNALFVYYFLLSFYKCF